MFFAVILSFFLFPCLFAQFFSPVQKRETWRIGETKKISYNTKFKNYTIALWQQSLVGDSASVGDILFSIRTLEDGSGPVKELTWTVATNKFDLGSSNVFFLWLFEGDSSNQGNFDFQQMSSAYFNITDEPEIPKVTLPLLTSTTAVFISTSELPTSTQALSFASSAETSIQQTIVSDGQTASAGTPTSTASQSAESSGGGGGGGGLPVGAQAGIGVGVGVIGITCVVCAVTWCRYLKRHQKALDNLQEMALSQPPAYNRDSARLAPAVVEAPQSPARSNGFYISSKPVEIG
ncbi:hypothetical protein CPAR01_03280 [Colletotrichum paranaense]|uniref:Mid2 domain-containing protein n=1 Tax=Colletotrichum paranaense TaxID=1914294 RepID=A0ABQ9T1X2_9PEZI|nr:uncharacterized protein CPAR01_03280 [Colletotrichum paranaense]KAK1545778.1 hypothetical protein CPAR01_03280 [Colletotrichum paranaense]